MRQSRLFPAVLVSFLAILLVSVSHLSAAVTSWNDFDSAACGYYNSRHHWGDNSTAPMLDPDKFNIYKIIRTTGSTQLLLSPDDIHAHVLFHDILISKTFLPIPDELLTRQIISDALNPDRPFGWHSDMRPTSESEDDTVFQNDADYTKAMRTPAPGSLLLVAFGLLSLRFTRRLRY